MKQLYYSFRALVRGRNSNIIKIISLSLGLFIGILLFARVAFMLSFNTGYQEPENLCKIIANYTMEGQRGGDVPIVLGPVPGTILKDFPNEVTAATLTQYRDCVFFLGNSRFASETIVADSLYFQTMGISVLHGNVSDLITPDVLFVSESFAQKVFGNENPIGKVLMRDKKYETTVKGVYADISENNSMRYDAVLSFATHIRYNWGYIGWEGGDSFGGYVRLRQPDDLDKVNARIKSVIEQYKPFEPEKSGFGVEYHLQPLRESYIKDPGVQRTIMIMSLLGLTGMLIAAGNYILIAVSSLSGRAKEIGVHKCNGAGNGSIFSMFMWETGLIIGISLLVVVLLVLNLREPIEDALETSINGLFTWQTLWVPVSVALLLFLIAGVLPGRLFSSIPVTQVFRRYTEANWRWKHPLLFVQFAGVAFIFGILFVVLAQYQQITTQDLGYRPDGVATAYHRFENPDASKSAILSLPMVEGVSVTMSNIASGYAGDGVYESGKMLFSTRVNICDKDYIPLMDIKIIEGRNLNGPGEMLVNEEYVRRTHWTDSPIGKPSGGTFQYYEGVIVGVMQDFVDNSFYQVKQPMLMVGVEDKLSSWLGCVTIRLKEPFEQNLVALNKVMEELFPTEDVTFSSLRKHIDGRYGSVRSFRNTMILAFISILLITLTGLFGYINDEVRRRSKEIGIRKVNGAEASDILLLLSRDIIKIAFPAVVVGAIGSYFLSRQWINQFAGSQIELNFLLYTSVAIGVLVLILISVLLKSWRIAGENPVVSIKSE
ncbi:putative ABC transport system permease protein [termite gut metagenome]|uniref:Putative ABC transport system permease protein n=1 Tax=termite gut metagenome TaxID=433724 RepID=A0A5J4RM57_9ZZZZ